jgi:hydroxymethylpyrimidine pyrophosphatase-like HAD family hydrolase
MAGARRFRLLAFDLDGTLLEADGSLSAESAAFLRRLQERGVVVVAATGRRLWSALPRLRGAGLTGPCVVQNGAQVAEIADASTLALTPLRPETVDALIARLRERGFAPLLFTDAPRGPREILFERGAPDPTGFLAWYSSYAPGHLDVVEPPLVRGAEAVLRIVTHGSEAALHALVAEIVAAHAGAVRGFVQEEMAVAGHRAELLAATADKATGVAWVARRAAIEPEEIVAVGDDNNDVELLRFAGHSLAAPDSSDAARRAADVALHGDGPRAVVAALERCFVW